MARLVLGTDINNTGTSSTVVEKLVPMPTSYCIQKAKSNIGKIINGNAFFDFGDATDVGDFALCRSYYLNENISGTVDLSNLTDISGESACEEMFAAEAQQDWDDWDSDPYSIDSQITHVDFSGLQKIKSKKACKYMFYKCLNLESVDFSSLTTLYGDKACYFMFSGCTGLTGKIDLSSLTHVEDEAICDYMFYECTGITSVDMSGLQTVGNVETTYYEGGRNFEEMFAGCTSLVSADLSGLTHILNGQQNMMRMFSGCTNLTTVNLSNLVSLRGMQHFSYFIENTNVETLSFDSLNDLGYSIGMSCVGANATNLKHIYFPALTTNSFNGKKDHFGTAVQKVTGCTIHFPSNLQSIIPTMSGYPNFGGTSTIILYDLPATE